MQELITGVVLAGGRGERLGGIDKALLRWRDQSFLEHITASLGAQTRRVLVSVRADSPLYAPYQTVTDPASDGEGPLGGLLAGLRASNTALTLFVPCDNPTPPSCLAERLTRGLGGHDIAYATYGGDNHWLYAVIRSALRDDLENFWQGGGRAPHRWYATQRCIAVSFDDLPATAFRNINTPEELAHLSDSGRSGRG